MAGSLKHYRQQVVPGRREIVERDLWRDEIEELIEEGFATVSRNPSDHETAVAYRTAIDLALTREGGRD